MMNININIITLSLLLSASTQFAPVQGQVYTCGTGYSDAAQSCNKRPKCPSGNSETECDAGQTCFAVPTGDCVGAPTQTPTKAPLRVCGTTRSDAVSTCQNGMRCPGGSGCPEGQGCYPIGYLECGYTTTTVAPVATEEATEPATAKPVVIEQTTEPATESAVQIEEALLSDAPEVQAEVTVTIADEPIAVQQEEKEPPLRICGSFYMEALNNCQKNPECPTGNAQTECPVMGQACFSIPAADCDTSPPTLAPVPTTPSPSRSPVIPPLNVCGANYSDAVDKCNSGVDCPSGDSALCPANEDCFSIPVDFCPNLVAKVCALTFGVATNLCDDETKWCAETSECELGEACFEVPTEVCGTMVDQEVVDAVPVASPSPLVKICADTFGTATNLCDDETEGCAETSECELGEACFEVPREICGTMVDQVVDAVPVATMPAMEDEEENTAPTNKPDFVFVCGDDYNDASSNICENEGCESGAGCVVGTCFAFSYQDCSELEATEAPLKPIQPTVTAEPPQTTEAPAQTTQQAATTQVVTTVKSVVTESSEAETTKDDVDKSEEETSPPATVQPDFVFVCGEDYNDASNNLCEKDRCDSGDGCAAGTCFAFAYQDCSEPATTEEAPPEPVQPIETVEAPQTTEAPAKTAQQVTTTQAATTAQTQVEETEDEVGSEEETTVLATVRPDFIFVCGEDYSDASTNTCTNEKCASGDGCSGDATCFAFVYQDCSETTATEVPDVLDTGDEPDESTANLDTESVAENQVDPSSPTSAAPNTVSPTKSPVFNTFFCAETYADAEANCWFAQPCSSGSADDCPISEACWGIAAEKCDSPAPTVRPTVEGPQPTGSPTISSAPTLTPTTSPKPTSKAPTDAPVVNTNFCGEDYTTATSLCSVATACPDGTCPGGEICYAGIVCDILGSLDNTLTISTIAPVVIQSPVPTSIASMAEGPTTRPTSFWDVISGGLESQTASPSSSVASTPNPTDGDRQFDPSVTHYCGADYTEAMANCYTAKPCQSRSNAECSGGMTCYEVGTCTTSPPATSYMPSLRPTTPIVANNEVANNEQVGGTSQALISQKPSFNTMGWDLDSISSNNAMTLSRLVTNSLVLGGTVFLGALTM